MSNLLTAAEAFAALQKVKLFFVRYAGNGVLKADKSFSTLDQMPATVFTNLITSFVFSLKQLN